MTTASGMSVGMTRISSARRSWAGKRLVIGRDRQLGTAVPRKQTTALRAAAAQVGGGLLGEHHALNAIGDVIGVGGINEDAGVANDLGNTAAVGRHHRRPARHRLEWRQ